MIGFFRKIRKKLADDNKPAKYFRYAIGEIVLVMVGILLALQVNNWNEERKAKNTEILLLNEFIVSLKTDLNTIDYEFQRHKEALESCTIILGVFGHHEKYRDSLSRHFSSSNNYTVFEFNQGAYQSLKSIGIETISNRSLSLKIVNLYDQWYNIYIVNQKNLTEDILSQKQNF